MARFQAVAYDVIPASPAQPRVAALLRELVRRDHQVDLWTAFEPGDWARDLERGGRLRIEVVTDPIHRCYVGLGGARAAAADDLRGPPGLGRKGLRLIRRIGRAAQKKLLFPDNQRVWSGRVASRVARNARGAVAVTFSRPESVGLVGQLVQRSGGRWWLDFADGWCFQGLRADAMTEGPRRERELALEREWVHAADGVSTVNRSLAEWFGSLRGQDDTIVYPNLIPDELLVEPGSTPARDDAAPLTLAHLGRLSLSDPSTTLEPVIEVLRRDADSSPRVRFLFYGSYGARDREDLARIDALGHDVRILEPVPRGRLRSERSRFDAALLVLSGEQRGSSSKLLDALGLDLPVFAVASPESDAARIIARAGLGEVAPVDDPARALARWREFVAGLAAGRYRVDPVVRAGYTSAAVVPGLADRLERLAAPRPTERSLQTS